MTSGTRTSRPSSLFDDRSSDRVVTAYGREYNLSRWPYGTQRPFYIKTDEEFVEQMIEEGFSTARLLYLRGVYDSEQMERHMMDAIEMPLFGTHCPHRILPGNCRHCSGTTPEYWMGP